MTKEYYQKHKEACNLRTRLWMAANKEKRRAYMREYVRNWKKTHRDSCNLTKRKWVEKNPEKYAKGVRNWIEANRERFLIGRRKRNRKWELKNPERCRLRQHRRRERERATKSCDKASRNVLCQLISDTARLKCGICGKNMPKNDRTIDHIVPLIKGGSGEIWNLRIVHLQCNLRKAHHMPEELNFHE